MEVLYRSCCGIDVHKQFLVACLLVVDDKGRQHKELRRFSTMTGELQQCVDWLEAARCQAVAMESTLEDTNLKLSSVLTDIMGKTGQQILFALLRGEEDPAVLADLALGRAMSKRDALTQALRGHISDHHRLLLQELLSLIERHTRGI